MLAFTKLHVAAKLHISRGFRGEETGPTRCSVCACRTRRASTGSDCAFDRPEVIGPEVTGPGLNTPDLSHRRAAVDHTAFSGEFSLRRLDPDRDLDLMHSWMNDPEVARFWKMPWSRIQIASYLGRQDLSVHSTPYLGELDGVPMSYFELYRADLDPLAQYYDAREHDAGLHGLMGPTEHRARGLAAGLLHTVTTWQLDADPRATRVIIEPDVENKRVIQLAEHAGFHRIADLNLPNKRAALMVRDRDDARSRTEPRGQRDSASHSSYSKLC
jgi:acetyl CoA:N6-hydroxylysine acetyl transferase